MSEEEQSTGASPAVPQGDILERDESKKSETRLAYESWANTRLHWKEVCYQAYCAGVLDERTSDRNGGTANQGSETPSSPEATVRAETSVTNPQPDGFTNCPLPRNSGCKEQEK